MGGSLSLGVEEAMDELEGVGLEDGRAESSSRVVIDSIVVVGSDAGLSSSASESSLLKMGFRLAGGGRDAIVGFLRTLSRTDVFDIFFSLV